MFAPHTSLLYSSSSGISSSLWVLVSGDSHHMPPNLSSFVSFIKSFVSVLITNGTHMPIVGVGILIHIVYLSMMYTIFVVSF